MNYISGRREGDEVIRIERKIPKIRSKKFRKTNYISGRKEVTRIERKSVGFALKNFVKLYLWTKRRQ